MSNKTFSLRTVYKQMKCYTLTEVDYKDRCELIEKVYDCNAFTECINYYKLMYCIVQVNSVGQEMLINIVFLFIAVWLMCLIAHVTEKYFGPMLKLLAKSMRMNQYMAGVTLLSLGNNVPEMATYLMPIRSTSPFFAFAIGNALAILLLSGGAVCYLRPFNINAHCAVRDLLFLTLSSELLIYVITFGNKTILYREIGLIFLYFVYLFVVIVDLVLMRSSIKVLKEQIVKLNQEYFTPQRYRELKEKQLKLIQLERDNKLVVLYDMGHVLTHSSKSKKKETEVRQIDSNVTRTIYHNPNNPKNLFLLSDFFDGIKPIEFNMWQHMSWVSRIYYVLQSPIALFCSLCLPVVDYTQNKHGWNKLLNCFHIIINPFVFSFILLGLHNRDHSLLFLPLDFTYPLMTLYLTVPLSILVFLHSRTDKPPFYHKAFLILTIIGIFILLTITAIELEVICTIISYSLRLSDDFASITFRSLVTALGDMIINVDMALKGYERMAFAAVLGVPLLSVTIGMWGPFLINKYTDVGEGASNSSSLLGIHGMNCYIFFLITIFSTLGWTLTFNFHSRRSAGILFFIIYIIYLLYATLTETYLIHQMYHTTHVELV